MEQRPLGVDLGAGSTTIAAAFGGTLEHRVYSDLGMGAVLPHLLDHVKLTEIARWLSSSTTPSAILAYIQHKKAYPYSLPMTEEEMAIEQALAREILRTAIRLTEPHFPTNATRASGKFSPCAHERAFPCP